MTIKKIFSLLCIFSLASTATANSTEFTQGDNKIKLEGFYGFQAGYRTQNHLTGLSKYVTDNKKRLGFYSESGIYLTAQQELSGITAGLMLVILPTSKPKTSINYNGSHIFLETEHGKMEIGSPHDAQAKMRITAYNIVAASGTNWNRYINLESPHMSYLSIKPEFDTSDRFYTESFANSFNDMSEKTEPSRKISYYTPKIHGLQFGISYTPDSSNTGGNRSLNYLDNSLTDRRFSLGKTGVQVISLLDGTIAILNTNMKDSFSAGLSYEYEISEAMGLKFSLTGEMGKAARSFLIINDKTKRTILSKAKLSKLRAYNLGAIFTYGNISCAASYGSLGKSLTTPLYHKNGRKTEFYNAALAYTQGPIKTSFAYFKSIRFKNTIDTFALGTEYLLTPGLVPYVEVAYIKAKGKPVHYIEAPKKSTKGTVAIIGAKLKF